MKHPLRIDGNHRYAQLRPDTDPGSVEWALAVAPRPFRLQFDEPLPETVLSATAEALRQHPDVELRAYGRTMDPSPRWLSGFEHVENLTLDLWGLTSFDMLAGFTSLTSLSLGATASRRPALGFLHNLTQLRRLSVEAHDKDFDVVARLPRLTRLHLRVPRVKTLQCLRGHGAVQVFTMNFGGIRDLSPLMDIPGLRGVELYQIRKLDTNDLDALGGCRALEALSLGALPHVKSLRALSRGPADTLRILNLEGLTGLASLSDLGDLQRLEQLGLYYSRPADKRLDVLLRAPRLQHVVAGDVYPRQQVESFTTQFAGTLHYRGQSQHPDFETLAVRWRAPVESALDRLT